MLTITSGDSSLVGGQSPAAFTWTRAHPDLPLCSLFLLLLIAAGEVFNGSSGAPAMRASLTFDVFAARMGLVRIVENQHGDLETH